MQDDGLAFWKGIAWVLAAYFIAFCAAIVMGAAMPFESPLWVGLVATGVGTAVVFGFSVAFRNSSFYDPYWSVAPVALVSWWALVAGEHQGFYLRQVLVAGLVAFWGARLTTNWVQGWGGLEHEDWRYVRLQRKTGRAYWLVSLLGIHYMPTLLVYLALWPAFEAIFTPAPLHPWLDLVAVLVTTGAVLLEATADGQLRAFRQRARRRDACIDEGVWRWSRHPNYLGELLFWWGIWLFAVAADPRHAVTCAGAVGMAVLFRFISIPMMERRLLERRPAYRQVMERVPMLLPWFPGRREGAAAEEAHRDAEPPVGSDPLVSEDARLALDTLPVVPPPPDDA